MAFADDLLKDGHHLAQRGGSRPRQASLRRAVSNAYYALFHLLIADFVINWRIPAQRARLGRMFDHKKMIQSEFKIKAGKPNVIEVDLILVSRAFVKLQQERHIADYDVGRVWTRSDVESTLRIADEAFTAWKRIRKHPTAQDHLLTMFGARRP